MYKIEVFKTLDGVLHETPQAAQKHAKKRYDEAMSALRDNIQYDLKLTANEAFKVALWIEQQKGHLVELINLENDLTIQPAPDPEDDDFRN